MDSTIQTSVKEMIFFPREQKIRFDVSEDYGSFTPGHWHEAIEVIYMLEGTAVLTLPWETVTLNSGQFILINSGLVHASRCPSRNKTILMQIPDELWSDCVFDPSALWFSLPFDDPSPLVQEQLSRLRCLLLELMQLQQEKRPGYLLAFTAKVFAFLDCLYLHFRRDMPGSYHPKSSRVLSRLDEVLSYTQKHYTSPISLSEAASVISLQPEYFCRFFREHMGMTYLQYLNDYRLSCFYRDLLSTEQSVSSLAEKHGFTNEKLFHRLFKERFHTTPLQARKESRIHS